MQLELPAVLMEGKLIVHFKTGTIFLHPRKVPMPHDAVGIADVGEAKDFTQSRMTQAEKDVWSSPERRIVLP